MQKTCCSTVCCFTEVMLSWGRGAARTQYSEPTTPDTFIEHALPRPKATSATDKRHRYTPSLNSSDYPTILPVPISFSEGERFIAHGSELPSTKSHRARGACERLSLPVLMFFFRLKKDDWTALFPPRHGRLQLLLC